MFLVLPFIRFVIGRTCRRISLWGILWRWSPKRCNSYSITEFFSLTFHCWTLARKFKNNINIYMVYIVHRRWSRIQLENITQLAFLRSSNRLNRRGTQKSYLKSRRPNVYLLCPSSVNFDGSCEFCPFTQTKYRQKLQLRENTVISSTVFSQWWIENKKVGKTSIGFYSFHIHIKYTKDFEAFCQTIFSIKLYW